MEKEHVWELLKKVSLPVFFFAILIILTFFQYSVSDTQKIAELLSKPLDENLINIYSFIVSLLSLFGIYFAIIQFAVEMSSQNNTFYGVNYVRLVLDDSYTVNFLKSKFFYSLLGLLVTLPVIYKVLKYQSQIILNNNSIITSFIKLIVSIWNSIGLLLILIFVLSLNIGFSKVWNISSTPENEKSIKCYNKIEDLISLMFKHYKKFEEYEYGPDYLDIIFDQILDLANRFGNVNYERGYFLNNLLAKVDFKDIKRKDEFISRYLDILNNENVQLIPIEDTENRLYYCYTLLDKISENADLNYVYKEISVFSRIQIFLNQQDNIIPYLLAEFIKNIFNQTSYEMLNGLVKTYLNKCEFITPLEVKLLELGNYSKIFIEGDIKENIDKNKDVYSNLFKIWINLFTQYEHKQIDLVFPEKGILENKRSGIYLITDLNIFLYACIYYKKRNPKSDILKELNESLDERSKSYYVGKFEMGNSDLDYVREDIYSMLVENYERRLGQKDFDFRNSLL